MGVGGGDRARLEGLLGIGCPCGWGWGRIFFSLWQPRVGVEHEWIGLGILLEGAVFVCVVLCEADWRIRVPIFPQLFFRCFGTRGPAKESFAGEKGGDLEPRPDTYKEGLRGFYFGRSGAFLAPPFSSPVPASG